MPGRDWPCEMSWRAVFCSPVEESFICCLGVGVCVWALGSVTAEGAMTRIVMVVISSVLLLFCLRPRMRCCSKDESSPYQYYS